MKLTLASCNHQRDTLMSSCPPRESELNLYDILNVAMAGNEITCLIHTISILLFSVFLKIEGRFSGGDASLSHQNTPYYLRLHLSRNPI